MKKGETVSVLLANTPAMLEAHYGVPMAGAVLNTLNTRLDAAIIAFSLDHAETRILIVDKEFSATVRDALALATNRQAHRHRLRRSGVRPARRPSRQHRIRAVPVRRRSRVRMADARR